MEKDILDNTELLGQIFHLDDGRLAIILPNGKQGFRDEKNSIGSSRHICKVQSATIQRGLH